VNQNSRYRLVFIIYFLSLTLVIAVYVDLNVLNIILFLPSYQSSKIANKSNECEGEGEGELESTPWPGFWPWISSDGLVVYRIYSNDPKGISETWNLFIVERIESYFRRSCLLIQQWFGVIEVLVCIGLCTLFNRQCLSLICFAFLVVCYRTFELFVGYALRSRNVSVQ
jgi:hypothetical protein